MEQTDISTVWLFGILFIAFFTSLIATIIATVQRYDQKKLTREVNLEEVPVKGKKIFHAEIEIVCQDGRIKNANLLTGTTKAFKEASDGY